jgi:hypothetical protein
MATYSEIKTVRIIPDCGDDKTVLRWQSPKGAWDKYPFTGQRVKELEVEDAGVFLSSNGRERRPLSRPGSETLLLRAGGLTEDETEGLETLKISPQVYIQKEDASLIPVRVVQNSFTIRDEANDLYTCEVKIETKLLNSQVN